MRHWCTVAILLASCVAASAQNKATTQPKGEPAAPQVPSGVTAHRDVEYARVEGQSLQLDLYVPAASGGVKPRLLVWVHGGSWRAGSRTNVPLMFATRAGYAVATISYRFSDVAPFPAQIHDCKGAIRFLRANAAKFGYDAQRVGVMGASAGGHLVSLLGTTSGGPAAKELEGKVGGNLDQSSKVHAVVDMCGAADFFSLGGEDFLADTRGVIAQLLGGSVKQKQALAKLASPITHITKDDPPFLILHGEADPTVNPQQSVKLHERLKQAGVPAELVMIPGGGHMAKEFFDAERRAMIQAFFDKHIKGGKAR